MLTYTYITNDAELARVAYASGVNRILVDWEVIGKKERQGHLDTVQSQHSFEDAQDVRLAVPNADLMVRLNPIHEFTPNEVTQALDAGANSIMLPMFRTASEVDYLSELISGRACLVPLLETPEAMACADEIALVVGVTELYVGLNDLHLALGLKFIFQPLASGLVDDVALIAKKHELLFGFGGIAKVDEGIVPGELVLSEHARLASNSVILSRTFYRADSEPGTDPSQSFSEGLAKLKAAEGSMGRRGEVEIKRDHQRFLESVALAAN